MEKQITISIEEYNKLIDMHTKREELPEKIEVKKISSKWWRWFKRASCSLLHYNKNAEQQKLIKRCINETASTILYNLINGYWRGDLSDYFKDGNFEVSLTHYKDTSYYNVMQWLDKKKYRMKIRQAKKIMKPSFRNGKIGYWHSRYDLHCMGFDGCGDHRITKAISLTKKK